MNEIKRIGTNELFWVGTVLLAMLFLASGAPYIETLLRTQYCAEGIGWVKGFRYCTTNENGLLFLPICVPIATGACAETELRTRYALFYCSRTGKKQYYMKKVLESALPGGLMVCLAEILVLLGVYIGLQNITSYTEEIRTGVIVGMILLSLVRGFLNGFFWAGVGSMTAVLTRNHYLAYAMPFVLYYVLTLFQSRYYPKLYFLSPRYWAAPVYYGNLFCITVLFGLCIGCACGLILAVKRRLDYV